VWFFVEDLLEAFKQAVQALGDDIVARLDKKRKRDDINKMFGDAGRSEPSNATRDGSFRDRILIAYGSRTPDNSVLCAVSNRRFGRINQSYVEVAHIWPVSSKGAYLCEFCLSPDDIDNVRNGIPMHQELHTLFDQRKAVIVYNAATTQYVYMVLTKDRDVLSKVLEGDVSGTNITVSACHGAVVQVPQNAAHRPFRRLLVVHMISAVQKCEKELTQEEVAQYQLFKAISDGVSMPPAIDWDDFY